MKKRTIGASGLSVSIVGLGCNNFGERLGQAESQAVIDKAIERGVTLFDTADSYGGRGGSETVLGEALQGRRKNVILATKFGWPMDDEGVKKGASRAYIMSAAEASLTRLRTDWIDLYQLHLPDPQTPIEETMRALEDLIRQGKVREIGCSNFSAEELEAGQEAAANAHVHGFISSQEHYNLLTRGVERKLAPTLRRHRMALIPYAPLASGLLSGKYHRAQPMPAEGRLTKSPKQAQRYLNDSNWRVIGELENFCRARGRDLLSLALSWLAAQELVPSVIAGAMTPEQIERNIDGATWSLSREELEEIDRITLGAQPAASETGS